MEPKQILDAWITRYGPLTADQRTRFLAREETWMLAGLPRADVLRALSRHQKLDAALRSARSPASPARSWPSANRLSGAGRRARGRAEWRQFIPCSLSDPEAPATLYLIRHAQMAALKIGVTAGGRVDQFGADGWDLVREWRFMYGYDAMEIEERVLDRWRNVLSMGAAVKSREMRDGYSETARYSPTNAADVIDFVSRCHEELSIAQELSDGALCDDTEEFPWSDEPNSYG